MAFIIFQKQKNGLPLRFLAGYTNSAWSVVTGLLFCMYAATAQVSLDEQQYGNPIEQKWLPGYAIKDILQDQRGSIWVATNAGLYKHSINHTIHYDITRYTKDKYLNNQLSSVVELGDQRLLVGTQSGLGLFEIDAGRVSLIGNKDEAVNQIVGAAGQTMIYLTDNRDVYHLTKTGVGNRYRGKSVLKGVGKTKKYVKAVAVLAKDTYLVGASDGLWQLKEGALTPTEITHAVTSMLVEGKDIWIGTDRGGIARCTLVGGQLQRIDSFLPKGNDGQVGSIQEIKSFNDGGVLFATTKSLFFVQKDKFPDPSSIRQKTIFDQNAINRIFVDKHQTIWIGSRNGLFTISPLRLLTHFTGFDNKPYQDMVINDMLLLSDDSLLMATNNAGIMLLDTRSNQLSSLGLPYNDVRLLRKARNGDLLVVGSNRFLRATKGVGLKDLRNAGERLPTRGINDVVEIAPGEYWFSHWRQKIIRINEGQADSNLNRVYREVVDAFSADAHVYVLELDSRDNLWVGTRGEGLLRINLTTHTTRKFTRAEQFPDQIMCIYEDSQHRLWVGARDKGLLLYNPESDDFQLFDHRHGLPSNTICAIQESTDGMLWFSTLNGMARLNEGRIRSFHSYNKESGIFNAEFLYNVGARGAGNTVYFGTGNGIYRFSKPSEITSDVPLVWTNIDLIEGTLHHTERTSSDDFSSRMLRQLEEAGTIMLQHDENSLQIGFANLDYAVPKQHLYLYRLLGHDTTWTVLQGENSMVRYLDLPPGDYVFQVMTTDPSNGWQRSPQSFALVIKPAFWNTGLAHVMYAIIFGALVFAGYRMVLRWKVVNRKLREEMESVKLYDQKMVHYADLSHEIKNRLTLILGPLEDALKNKQVNFQLLNRVYEQGQRLERLSDQIMNIRKSDSGDFLLTVEETDITALVSKIIEDARPLAMVKDIQILFDPVATPISGWCDAEIVEIVMTNILNNAIKYCAPGDTVKLALDTEYIIPTAEFIPAGSAGNYLVCTVSDTGEGILEAELSKITRPFYRTKDKQSAKEVTGKGIGLDLVNRLIKKHHGQLEIKSRYLEFTTVAFYLPIDKRAFTSQELRLDIKSHPIVIANQSFRDIDTLILPEEPYRQRLVHQPPTQRFGLLIVDDDPDLLAYLTELFSAEFDVHTAEGGLTAMAKVEKAHIDLIICDLDMPDMNGLSFCGMVKSDAKYKNIPFVLLTGKNSEAQKLAAFEFGVDDFVEKPFRSELLTWRVKSLLRNAGRKVQLRTVIVPETQAVVEETPTERFIQEVVDSIERHLDKHYLNVDFLADELCMSRATFYRKMEEMFNESPSSFIKKYRLKKAIMFIKTGRFTLKQVSAKTGFNNPKYFSKCFKSEFGVLPSAYYEDPQADAATDHDMEIGTKAPPN